jgi:PhnB protein
MQLNTYLYFDGQCEEAFQFYARVLGGKIATMMPHKGSPAESSVPAEWQQKILHARLEVGNSVLMASDAPPGRGQKMGGFSVNIAVDSVAEAERIFAALSDGGNQYMPMAKTFFAERFGMLTDRYGVQWMVNCEHA